MALGTLRIALAEQVSAHELQSALALLDRLYFDALWLREAELAPGNSFPMGIAPTPEQELWIQRLEIGTPNLIELLGQADVLVQLAGVLTTLLGVPVAASKAMKNVADFRKSWFEGNEVRQRYLDRARALREKGKISAEALAHKLELEKFVEEQLPAAAAIIPPQNLEVEGKPKKRRGRDRSAELADERAALGRPELLPLLRAYAEARRALGVEPTTETVAALRKAYDRLAEALHPMPRPEVDALLERITGRQR
jgi:hypothetical protein